jgi:hypothetical protein
VGIADDVLDPRAALELDDRELVDAAGGRPLHRLERVDRLAHERALVHITSAAITI